MTDVNIKRIALTGRAGAGKTELAKWFVENYDFVKIALADPVKYYAKEILLRPIDKHNPKDRSFLQHLGTDLARSVDPEIWLKHFEQRMRIVEELANGVVCDDVRFVNEAAWMRSHGFVVVKVTGRGYKLNKELSSHPSEAEVDLIEPDFSVDNSGTLENTVKELLGKLVCYTCGIEYLGDT